MSSEEIAQGGAESALDMRNPKDRGMLRRFIANRPRCYGTITEAKRAIWVQQLEDIRNSAFLIAENQSLPMAERQRAAAEVRSCLQTGAMMDMIGIKVELAAANARLKDLHHLESQEQEDRHHDDRMKREDDRNKLAALSLIPDAVLIQIAKAHNRVDLLPPRLREIANGPAAPDRT